jgi:serine phosphatase RsbU (regulator of sigma subunit)
VLTTIAAAKAAFIPCALLRIRYVLCCLWRKLRDASLGHVPPLILRTHGSIRRLASTRTVLGLLLNWEGSIEEEKLYPGDLLVISTDGVTPGAESARQV